MTACSAGPSEVPAATTLAAALQRRAALWPRPKLEIGRLESGWMTVAAFAASPDALADQLAYQGSFAANVDARSRATFLIADYAHALAGAVVPLFVGEGLVPPLAPERWGLRFEEERHVHDGHDSLQRQPAFRLLDAEDGADPAGAMDGDAGPEALAARLRLGLEAHLAPLITALAGSSGIAPSALWRLAGDAFGAAFLAAGRRLGCADAARAAALKVLKQPGSPLANPQMQFVDVVLRDPADPDRILAAVTLRARGGCCRFYLVEGGSLCSTCVLHDRETQVRLVETALRRRAAGG